MSTQKPPAPGEKPPLPIRPLQPKSQASQEGEKFRTSPTTQTARG